MRQAEIQDRAIVFFPPRRHWLSRELTNYFWRLFSWLLARFRIQDFSTLSLARVLLTAVHWSLFMDAN